MKLRCFQRQIKSSIRLQQTNLHIFLQKKRYPIQLSIQKLYTHPQIASISSYSFTKKKQIVINPQLKFTDQNRQLKTTEGLQISKKFDLKNLNFNEKTLKVHDLIISALNSINIKETKINPDRQLAIQELSEKQLIKFNQVISLLNGLPLKEYSNVVHKFLVNNKNSSSVQQKLLWKEIQRIFIQKLEPTTQPEKIRSFSKIFYCLVKSKTHRNTSSSTINTSISSPMENYETKFAVILPFATHQSFTMIVTSFSRMGPISEQFAYIIQSFYYRNIGNFNARQKVQIMYTLTRNGRSMDSSIIKEIDNMNLNQIITMLRCFENAGKLFSKIQHLQKDLLTFSQKYILLRKNEMNVIDLGQICHLYFTGTLSQCDYKLSSEMQTILTQSYTLLKRNINEVTFLKIWKPLPKMLNSGYLTVSFMEEVIRTIKILRKKKMLPDRIWKVIKSSAQDFQNLEIRIKMQKIY